MSQLDLEVIYTRAFLAGQQSFYSKEHISENPFREGIKSYEVWNRGFQHAEMREPKKGLTYEPQRTPTDNHG